MSARNSFSPAELAQYIDHTLLRPDAKEDELHKLCDEALEFQTKTVCVEAKWLPLVSRRLMGSHVLPITVVGFPTGNEETAQKVEQTLAAVAAGAAEIDTVLNRGWLKQKKFVQVFEDIHRVVLAAGVPVKVIFETCDLDDSEKIQACALAIAAGAKFVKTSTGFSTSGATEADVRLMRAVVGPDFGVKASGGIRSLETALAMIAAGANRLGTSSTAAILKGVESKAGY